jgi:hypothetical protein
MFIVKINNPWGGANFDPRPIIWRILVEVYQTIPYALGLVGVYKKIFLIYSYNSFWLPWQPDFYMESNSLNNLSPSAKEPIWLTFRSTYFFYVDLMTNLYVLPWTGSIKPSLQHFQFCRVRLSLGILYLSISL